MTSDTMRVTILGCGSSGGVPTVGNIWGACDSTNPKNRRRRVSILVEAGSTRVLVDTSPDLREQLLDAAVDRLDAVVYTHDHADHCHGIDDLRSLAYAQGGPIDAYGDARTLETLGQRFPYIFPRRKPSRFYPPLLRPRLIEGPFAVGELEIVPFAQGHGITTTLGLRFGPMAYSTDVVKLDEAAFATLAGIELWIVDALREDPHPTHSHFAQTLEWIARVQPRRAVLTHLNHTVDYASLKAKCPPGVEPGYDGLAFELPLDGGRARLDALAETRGP
jgi:phosphoribosyl 1,2-cyclic phosphate phosphodiesterase